MQGDQEVGSLLIGLKDIRNITTARNSRLKEDGSRMMNFDELSEPSKVSID